MKLTGHDVNRIHGALQRISDLDKAALWIAEDIESRADTWGEKVRDVFGRNRLSQWRNRFLGEVVATAIINELMRERAELEAGIEDHVEAPRQSIICPQHPDRENR